MEKKFLIKWNQNTFQKFSIIVPRKKSCQIKIIQALSLGMINENYHLEESRKIHLTKRQIAKIRAAAKQRKNNKITLNS